MAQTRKRYDRQFKTSAVRVVLEGERTVAQLSGDPRIEFDSRTVGLGV